MGYLGNVTRTEVNTRVFEPFQFSAKESGTSIAMYVCGFSQCNSAKWGEFTAIDGLVFDVEAQNVEEFEKSIKPISIVATTVLANYINNGVIAVGECYEIVLKLKKGEAYVNAKTGKKEYAKATHYKVQQFDKDEMSEALQILQRMNPLKNKKSSVDECDFEYVESSVSECPFDAEEVVEAPAPRLPRI